jgi:hypothetical protein
MTIYIVYIESDYRWEVVWVGVNFEEANNIANQYPKGTHIKRERWLKGRISCAEYYYIL